jgi:DNA-binding response OmpR family regulator
VNVLVAEDDAHIRQGLTDLLEDQGYRVTAVADGAAALEAWRRARPDFICLDIMMPGLSGYDVCRAIRADDPAVPIMFISAKSEEIDRVLGLELGADDFILKPFGVHEVLARIRAITRRCGRFAGQPVQSFILGDLEVIPAQLRARRGATEIDLSLRDLKILQLLHDRQGEAIARDVFFRECWGLDHIPNSRTLDQHIAQLRKRIERDPRQPAIILTVHGVGYRCDA